MPMLTAEQMTKIVRTASIGRTSTPKRQPSTPTVGTTKTTPPSPNSTPISSLIRAKVALSGRVIEVVPALPTVEQLASQVPVPKPDVISQSKGLQPIDLRCEAEGQSISKADFRRVQGPKRRPGKSRGHGTNHFLLVDIGARLRDKKPPELVKPVAVPEVKFPNFAMKLLRERPECDFTKGPLKDLNFGILSSKLDS